MPGQENMALKEFFTTGSAHAVLFPFVREAVANITMRGRFGPVWLNPVNFGALVAKGSVAASTSEESSLTTPEAADAHKAP
jgi:preprotein translocase subunit SecB